ncbi:MAG: YqeG family HAD IIIA-type phosphatase [Actinomycetia bacterium]|nr:YqeG family HAD IIIA-type phosphatase [Actinomycetes bacterium]
MKSRSPLGRLRPDYFINSVYDIDAGWLKNKGIHSLIVDVDNTIVARDVTMPDALLREWVVNLQNSGIELVIVSNNWSARVKQIAKELDLQLLAPAAKPLGAAFKRAIVMLGSNRGETAIIGDQLFTDVLGGNGAGIKTILSVPVGAVDLIHTKMLRVLEKFFLKRLSKKVLVDRKWQDVGARK